MIDKRKEKRNKEPPKLSQKKWSYLYDRVVLVCISSMKSTKHVFSCGLHVSSWDKVVAIVRIDQILAKLHRAAVLDMLLSGQSLALSPILAQMWRIRNR